MLSPTPIPDVFAALMLVTATVSGTRLAAARLPAGRWPAGSPRLSRPGRAHGRAVRPAPTTTSPTC